MRELYTGIYEVEGLVSEADLATLSEYVRGVDESVWFEKNSHGLFVEINQENIKQVFDSYIATLESMFDGKTILPISRISRVPQGKKMDGHTDNLSEPRCIRGVVLYLNDDFAGGELHYKDVGVTYKPRAGSVIVHDAGYFHEVLPVTEGTRYMATTFVWQ
jgi:hypothetical protein